MNKQSPEIQVGVLHAETIRFRLNGDYYFDNYIFKDVEAEAKAMGDSDFSVKIGNFEQTFSHDIVFSTIQKNTANFNIYDVIIGIKFHWERAVNQKFKGNLRLYAENGKLTAVNILDLEEYLLSVISSEMSSTASLELLKTHAVISRSWLIAQLEKRKEVKSINYTTIQETHDGYVRWYDREDHDCFDVCADDHCQRYQGLTMILSERVAAALRDTCGEVLSYNNKVCDARFYKCCGGVTELFENTWEPINHPYLAKVIDNKIVPEGYAMDLTIEANARQWIVNHPEAFCNTKNIEVLSQVLNDYDQETTDFYRWEVEYTQEELKQLLKKKVNIEIGDILDLIPVERGVSGRLIRLKIKGTEGEITIGKELEIRKALSETHLYSSAFIVDTIDRDNVNAPPKNFLLRGAGWGHGVGLCQIGAALMSMKGYTYRAILEHYFPNADLKIIY